MKVNVFCKVLRAVNKSAWRFCEMPRWFFNMSWLFYKII